MSTSKAARHQLETIADLQLMASDAYSAIRTAYRFAGKDIESEAFHMHLAGKCAEEGAEVLAAYLHASGWARRQAEWEAMDEELADMVISAFILAHAEGRDLPRVIAAKVAVIFTRGWKSPALQ